MKIQILVEDGKCDFRFFKKALEQAKQNYSEMRLPPFEIFFSKNVIRLDADLLIDPINLSVIKVGFRIRAFASELLHQREVMSWITITDQLDLGLNALSNFLFLIIGTALLPSGIGWYNTDLDDVKVAISHGKSAVLTTLSEINLHSPDKAMSCVIWSTYKGKFTVEFNRVANTVCSRIRNQDVLVIMNVTDCPVLNKSNIVLLVKK